MIEEYNKLDNEELKSELNDLSQEVGRLLLEDLKNGSKLNVLFSQELEEVKKKKLEICKILYQRKQQKNISNENKIQKTIQGYEQKRAS